MFVGFQDEQDHAQSKNTSTTATVISSFPGLVCYVGVIIGHVMLTTTPSFFGSVP